MPHLPHGRRPSFNIFRFNLFKQILIELEEKNVFPGAGHKSFRSEVVLKHAVFHHTKVLRLILPKENSPTEIFPTFFSPFDRNNLPTYYRDLKRRALPSPFVRISCNPRLLYHFSLYTFFMEKVNSTFGA